MSGERGLEAGEPEPLLERPRGLGVVGNGVAPIGRSNEEGRCEFDTGRILTGIAVGSLYGLSDLNPF